MSEILKSVGEIDILVLGATSTAAGKVRPAKEVPAEVITDVYNVNVIGLFHLIHQYLALPSTSSGGRKTVIHVSSAASQFYQPGSAGYCSSKAAANQIVEHFAFDDPESNVKFFNIHPGAVLTQLVKNSGLEDLAVWEDGKLFLAWSERSLPGEIGANNVSLIGRLPGDFSVWLASPEAEFLNGRFVWAQWDVDELISLKEKVAADPTYLTISLIK